MLLPLRSSAAIAPCLLSAASRCVWLASPCCCCYCCLRPTTAGLPDLSCFLRAPRLLKIRSLLCRLRRCLRQGLKRGLRLRRVGRERRSIYRVLAAGGLEETFDLGNLLRLRAKASAVSAKEGFATRQANIPRAPQAPHASHSSLSRRREPPTLLDTTRACSCRPREAKKALA